MAIGVQLCCNTTYNFVCCMLGSHTAGHRLPPRPTPSRGPIVPPYLGQDAPAVCGARGAIKSAAPARRPCADSARSGLPEPATVPLRPAYLPTDMDAERQPRRGICPNDAPQRVGREIWTEHTMVCSVHISLPTLCGASFGQIPRRGCRSASMSVGRYAGRNGTVAGSGSPLRAESAQGRRAGAADLIAPRAPQTAGASCPRYGGTMGPREGVGLGGSRCPAVWEPNIQHTKLYVVLQHSWTPMAMGHQ